MVPELIVFCVVLQDLGHALSLHDSGYLLESAFVETERVPVDQAVEFVDISLVSAELPWNLINFDICQCELTKFVNFNKNRI